jgi:hypothetical protein
VALHPRIMLLLKNSLHIKHFNMKFLIQKIDGEIRHDFAFTLLESIRFLNWIRRGTDNDIKIKYANTYNVVDPDLIYPNPFKPSHKDYVPIGSVDFVQDFLMHFYNLKLMPINIPNELLGEEFTKRFVFNGTEKEVIGDKFVKSNDIIKGYAEFVDDMVDIPEGNYQISDVISIDSEWRAFVYKGKLVGLQNYSGEFTKFLDVTKINNMISAYKSSPIAYTLDVGVNSVDTFIIECHLFSSVGLYGFNSQYLATMFNACFKEYLRKNGKIL